MFHTQNILVIFGHLFVIFDVQIGKIVSFGNPLSVYSVKAANLPPSFTSDNLLEFIRAEPVNKNVSGLVA